MIRATVLALCAGLLLLPASAAGRGEPVVGGASFNAAPLLAPGSYADTVTAGGAVYWRVRLTKGQTLRATATVDGPAGPAYRIDLHSPLRMRVATTALKRDGQRAARGTVRSSRVLGFERVLASDYDADAYPAPGEWFVSVSAAGDREGAAELPVELTVRVAGRARPSSATFAGRPPGPHARTPAPSEPTGTAPVPTRAAAAPSGAAATLGLVGGLALVAGLGLGALAALVLRLRRPASPG